jgi:hypothetical protein
MYNSGNSSKNVTGASIVDGTVETEDLADGSVTNLKMATKPVEATAVTNTAGQDWAGVAYTDPDAVGANPTAKIYPDGTVVGSTDNGKYTKYPNGDLICTGLGASVTTAYATGTLYYNNSAGTYPIAFTRVDSRSYNSVNSTGTNWSSADNMTLASSLVGFNGRIMSNVNTAVGYILCIAIGRWK